jgi:predicted DNA-binding transcriptional regulator AlpA
MRRLLSKSDTASLVNLHSVSVMRLVRKGLFPPPIKLTPAKNGRVRFVEEDIERWLLDRKASPNGMGGAAQ